MTGRMFDYGTSVHKGREMVYGHGKPYHIFDRTGFGGSDTTGRRRLQGVACRIAHFD